MTRTTFFNNFLFTLEFLYGFAFFYFGISILQMRYFEDILYFNIFRILVACLFLKEFIRSLNSALDNLKGN